MNRGEGRKGKRGAQAKKVWLQKWKCRWNQKLFSILLFFFIRGVAWRAFNNNCFLLEEKEFSLFIIFKWVFVFQMCTAKSFERKRAKKVSMDSFATHKNYSYYNIFMYYLLIYASLADSIYLSFKQLLLIFFCFFSSSSPVITVVIAAVVCRLPKRISSFQKQTFINNFFQLMFFRVVVASFTSWRREKIVLNLLFSNISVHFTKYR